MSEHEKPPPGPRSDETADETMYPAAPDEHPPDVPPSPGGYEGRDPKKEMPRVPSSPESDDDGKD